MHDFLNLNLNLLLILLLINTTDPCEWFSNSNFFTQSRKATPHKSAIIHLIRDKACHYLAGRWTLARISRVASAPPPPFKEFEDEPGR